MPAVAADPVKPAAPAAGLKITKLTGTVNLMKDGVIVMTLKPGDALPTLVDPAMTFAVVDGSIEVEAGGQTMVAATGSNFTVNAENGADVKIMVAEGAPVEVKGAAGNSMVVTQNSEIQMKNDGVKMEIAIDKGSALVTTPSGEAPKTINAGEKIEMAPMPPAPPVAPVAPAVAPGAPVTPEEAPAAPEAPVAPELPVLPPPTVPENTNIPTQIVQESCGLSNSTPGCIP